MKLILPLCTTAYLLAFTLFVNAQSVPGSTNTATNSAQSNASLSSTDSAFLTKAAQGGMTEVALGNLAKEKGSSTAVKDFGNHMVTDHTNINNELMSLSQKKGCAFPTVLDKKHQEIVDRFSKLSGTDFDNSYIKLMVRDHKKDAAEFQEEADNSQDPDIKAFAAKNLPTIKEHLSMIQQIKSQEK